MGHLILDDISKSDTYPTNIVESKTSTIEHEATVSKISDDKLFIVLIGIMLLLALTAAEVSF